MNLKILVIFIFSQHAHSYFEPPFKVPAAGYTLFVAVVEAQLWEKFNITEYDRDVSYLGETIANKAKTFRVELYHDQPVAWEDSSIKLIFRSDELTYIENS